MEIFLTIVLMLLLLGGVGWMGTPSEGKTSPIVLVLVVVVLGVMLFL